MKRRSHFFIRRLAIAVAILVFGAMLVACAEPAAEEATVNPLTGISWEWTSLTLQPSGMVTEVVPASSYTITFNEDGTLSGRADCNNFTGTYSQTNGFTITLGAITSAACGEQSMDREYLELLSNVVAGGPDGQGNLALEVVGGEQRMLFQNGGTASN